MWKKSSLKKSMNFTTTLTKKFFLKTEKKLTHYDQATSHGTFASRCGLHRNRWCLQRSESEASGHSDPFFSLESFLKMINFKKILNSSQDCLEKINSRHPWHVFNFFIQKIWRHSFYLDFQKFSKFSKSFQNLFFVMVKVQKLTKFDH